MTVFHVDFPSGQPGRYGGDNTLLNAVLFSDGELVDDPRPGADGTGKVWGLTSGHTIYMQAGLPDVDRRFVFSFRLYMSTLPTELSVGTIFQLWEDFDDVGFNVQLYPDGSFGNTDPCIVTGAWQLVEVMMGGGVGFDRLIIRVDGQEILDSPGGEIYRPPMPDLPEYFWRIINSGAPNNILIKDFVLQYGTAADFIGPANVRELLPVSDTSSGWSKTGGATEFGILDNSPPDTGQYISAPDGAIGTPSVTVLDGLHADTIAIHGLFPSYYASSPDGGTLQGSLVAAATPRAGSTFNPVAADYHIDSFEEDPDTSTPWVVATVEALSLSLNRTA